MMCVFVGNTGSVAVNVDMFPCNVECMYDGIYINGVCIYVDEECDEEVVSEVYSHLMQLLTVTLKEEYPSDEVHVFQVGE